MKPPVPYTAILAPLGKQRVVESVSSYDLCSPETGSSADSFYRRNLGGDVKRDKFQSPHVPKQIEDSKRNRKTVIGPKNKFETASNRFVAGLSGAYCFTKTADSESARR